MKNEIIVFISDGYADWELGFVCAELNKSEKNFKIATLALTNEQETALSILSVIVQSIQEIGTISKSNVLILIILLQLMEQQL